MTDPYEGMTCREIDVLWCLAAINTLSIDDVSRITGKVMEYRDHPDRILKQIGIRQTPETPDAS